jgi:hypothetical protein
MALHLVFIVRASNKSALNAAEAFLREIERIKRMLSQVRGQSYKRIFTPAGKVGT